MKCPICGSKTKVIDSKPNDKRIKRRRECLECMTAFKTQESIIFDSIDQHLLKKYQKGLMNELPGSY